MKDKAENRRRAREWQKANPERYKRRLREWNLKAKFGLAIEEYEAMVTKQDGKCACCGKPVLKNMAVDHCHESGKVRALLCHTCNNHLGIYEKSRSMFEEYLAKYAPVEAKITVSLDVPVSIRVYAIMLRDFAMGMVAKLDKNSHKSTPTRKDVHQIVALLLGEVSEFLEQVSVDREDENTEKELHDIANFAFLAAVALKIGHKS